MKDSQFCVDYSKCLLTEEKHEFFLIYDPYVLATVDLCIVSVCSTYCITFSIYIISWCYTDSMSALRSAPLAVKFAQFYVTSSCKMDNACSWQKGQKVKNVSTASQTGLFQVVVVVLGFRFASFSTHVAMHRVCSAEHFVSSTYIDAFLIQLFSIYVSVHTRAWCLLYTMRKNVVGGESVGGRAHGEKKYTTNTYFGGQLEAL